MITKKLIIAGLVVTASLFSTLSFANYNPRAWPGHLQRNQNYHQHPNMMAGRYYPQAPRQRIIVINRGYNNPYYGMYRHRPLFEFYFGK